MPTPYRNALDQLPPYALAEQSLPGVERVIQLGQNELGVGPSPAVLAALNSPALNLNRYPDIAHERLREAIAAAHSLKSEHLLCGAGSMELLGLLASVYTQPGTDVVVTQFGYKFFQVQCVLAGAAIVVVPEPGMRIDVAALAAAVTDRTRLVFLVNPGNPTGALLEAGAVRRLRETLPENVMLALDGAYAEFADSPDFEAGFDLVDEGQNIVVLRTFSKAYALAGLRVGWLYGPADVIEALSRARSPNTVTTTGLIAAEAAVSDRDYLQKVVGEVIELREQLRGHVKQLGLHALPSQTNFVMVACPDDGPIKARDLTEGLRKDGIIIRPMGSYDLPNHVRITVGAADEMALLHQSLQRLLA